MKRIDIKIIALLFLISGLVTKGYTWGFWAHKRMNRQAVFTLPTSLVGFYKKHIEYISSHAVDPDERKFTIEKEAPRHYIDLDHYGTSPFNNVPRAWPEAVEKFTADTLREYGIVPWHTVRVLAWLTQAFEEQDKEQILQLSADIGHYVADACVPLHTTENYDGQLTGQEGIHAFWESRIPELFGEDYHYFTGKANYLNKPLHRIWQAVLESHSKVDSVLQIDRQLRQSFSEDRMYVHVERGTQLQKRFSRAYAHAYQQRAQNMIARRMRRGIQLIGSFWYTAWVRAGQPELTSL